MTPFDVAFHHASEHGVLSAVHLPDTPDPVHPSILERLHPEEQAFALNLRGYRQPQFVAGRLALRAACEQLGVRPPPLLADSRGAPMLPRGVVGSVSHKRTLAIAMASRDFDGTLGCDLEDLSPARLNILDHVLTEHEASRVLPLPEDRRWIALVQRFSLKESIYKALDPYVHRYVGFHEVEVWPDLEGRARVHFQLTKGEGPFVADARYLWLAGRLVTSVRIRRARKDGPDE